jgi:hypothetical protein
MLGKSGTAGLLAYYALASASSMSNDRAYSKLSGQGFVNSNKPRNENAKSKRAKDKKAKASRKKNRS